MSETFQPFLVEPIRVERIWGGHRLGFHDPPYGEAWVIGDRSRVGTGTEAGRTLEQIVAEWPIQILGAPVYGREGASLPLLIKFLDPVQWLSIQVHPDDQIAVALEGEGTRGKTEAWYVLDADPHAELIGGVRSGVDASEVAAAIENGTLEPLLERFTVRPGDALLIEAGLIHALGPGLFIYEVQQNSDLTYRVSDWGRPVSTGRALHLAQSMRAARPELRPRFAPMVKRPAHGSFRVLDCRYFALELVDSDGRSIERSTDARSFEAVTIIDGSARLVHAGGRLAIDRYGTAFVPAVTNRYRLESDAPFRALVSTVP